jgi:hypothetical protein
MAEINSDNSTIDSFFTNNLGRVNDNQYRDFLFKKNLFEPDGNDRNRRYFVDTKSLIDPGNVSQFYLNESFFPIEVYSVRKDNIDENKYGPEIYKQFTTNNQPPIDFIEEDSGYEQYKSNSTSDFRASIIGQQLGFGYGAGITFDSELNDIAKKVRKEEFKQRVKQNFTQQTVNRINLDPIGLLTGQDIFLKDYTITKGTGLGGQLIEFSSNLFGVNIPFSPIPDGAFGRYGDLSSDGERSNDLESYESILRYTGSGQKSILFNSLSQNRFGPTLVGNQEPPAPNNSGLSSLIKKAENTLLKLGGPGEAPQLRKYTDKDQTTFDNSNREISLVDKINKSIGNTINSLINKQNGKLSEWELPSNEADDISRNSEMGFDSLGIPQTPTEVDNWSIKGVTDSINLTDGNNPFNVNYNVKTGLPSYDLSPSSHEPFQNLMYWGDRSSTVPGSFNPDLPGSLKTIKTSSNPFKRGLLKYTQDLINSSDIKENHKARFIGVVNSDDNYNDNGLHKNYSQGNTVLTTEGDAYCRSWSVRRVYNTHDDLIRSSRLWRENSLSVDPKSEALNQYTTLQESGKPKIAWEYNDTIEKKIEADLKIQADLKLKESKLNQLSVNLDESHIIPYMFSIENLAWKDAPQQAKLLNCEKGPHGGRIMWFPPYDISFTDNTSINWDSTNFIGRAEPIYTYNTTERTGNLSFSIVVDHPSVLNKIKSDTKVNLESYFAGCDIDEAKRILSTALDKLEVVTDEPELLDSIPETTIDIPDIEIDLKYHFKNARSINDKDNNSEYGNPSSDCPNGTLGRCIDTTYESNQTFEAVDNPGLYKISFDGVWPNDEIKPFTDNNSFSDVKIKTPPCPGVTKWGPNANIFLENENFCRETTAGSFTSVEGDVYNNTQFGILLSRPGFNYDFFNKTFEINGNTYTGISGLAKFLTTDPIGKAYKIEIQGAYSSAATSKDGNRYNIDLANDRAKSVKDYLLKLMLEEESINGGVKWEKNGQEVELYEEKTYQDSTERWSLSIQDRPTKSKSTLKDFVPTPFKLHPQDYENAKEIEQRYGSIRLVKNEKLIEDTIKNYTQKENERINSENSKISEETKKANEAKKQAEIDKIFNKYAESIVRECEYFEAIKREDPFIYNTLREKLKNFHPAFHAITPEGLNSRLTFLQQCGRQGPSISDPNQPQNTAFGRPPVCILRIGDFYFTKIIIDSINISYDPLQWDLNPEGVGVQPMIAKIDLSFKFIGGSSLKGPITQLQNAVSYNFFANTALYERLEKFTTERGEFIYGPIAAPSQEKEIITGFAKDYKTRAEVKDDPITTTTPVDAEIPQETKDKIENCTEDTPCEDVTDSVGKNLTNNIIVTNNNISAANTKFDLGKVKASEKAEWQLNIENNSDEPIIIQRIKYKDNTNSPEPKTTPSSKAPILQGKTLQLTLSTNQQISQEFRTSSGIGSRTLIVEIQRGSKTETINYTIKYEVI